MVNSYAFFNEELIRRKDMPYFPNANSGLWYIAINAGMTLYGQESVGGRFDNFNTNLTGNSKIQYTPYGGVALGYKKTDLNFIFELAFEYIAPQLDKTYNFSSGNFIYNNTDIASFTTSLRRYKIGTNIYYNFFNPFNMTQNIIGIFFGIGFGLSFQKNYISIVNEYINEVSTAATNGTGSGANPFSSDNGFFFGSKFGIALYYEISGGFMIDIGNYAMTRIKLKYTIYTKPLLNIDFTLDKTNYESPFLNAQLLSLELSLLFKTS